MVKLMIIDEEVDICDFVKNFFKERNFEVFTAYSSEEALRIVDLQYPQIILLDAQMSVMDGMRTLEELHRRDKKSKVIMITTAEDPEKANEAKQRGAAGYITKPLSLELLEQSVLRLAEQISTG
ncbi:MAG: response regulator [Candidatus Omnitrophica bacterium]|nr:response regulator [Candidatus Omnitrophota bacterium]